MNNFRIAIVALIFFVSACAQIDYSDYESEVDIHNKPIKEVESLAKQGNLDAKFRLAIDKMAYSRDEAIEEIKSLYYDSKHLISGYYIANRLSNQNERLEILREISDNGNSYTSACAKCDILAENLKLSLDSLDKEKFDKYYSELLSYAKSDFQPAAVHLKFFIETNLEKIEKLKDVSKDILFLYKTLARISKTDEKYYALEYAEALAKSGKWDEAVAMLKPLADDFTKHGSFRMGQLLSQRVGGNFYAEAKAAALMACACDNGLGTAKDENAAKRYRDKVMQLQNEWFLKSFARMFDASDVDKNSFVFDSPEDAKAYRAAAKKIKNSRAERLRNYYSRLAKKISDASKKSLDDLKSASDEIEKVEYAKKLLDLKSINVRKYTIGKYNNDNAKEAISILETLADEGSQYAHLTLAELYKGGNSRNATFSILNMPVDFDAGKARMHADKASHIDNEWAWMAQADKLLGDLDLLKTNAPESIALDGYTVKTDSIDSALQKYRTAANLGYAKAFIRLFEIYNNGIPIGYGKYLVEPDKSLALEYAKKSVDLGDMRLMHYVEDSSDRDKSIQRKLSIIKKHLDSKGGAVAEAFAILQENGQASTHSSSEPEKIKDSVAEGALDSAFAKCNSEEVENNAGKKFAQNAAHEKCSIALSSEFSDYFKSLPKTQENRFLYSLACVSENKIDEASKELKALAAERYPEAVRIIIELVGVIYGTAEEIDRYCSLAEELKLPIPNWRFNSADYNIARYEETKDDAFLQDFYYICTPKVLEFLSKHSRNNKGALYWAAFRLFNADAQKSLLEFDEVLDFIKNCAKDPKLAPDANVLLAYAYSGNPKMKNNPQLSSSYIKAAGESWNGRARCPAYKMFCFDSIDDMQTQSRFNLFSQSINENDNGNSHNLSYIEKNSLEDLRAANKKNPKSLIIKRALAEKEKALGNYAEALKLYKELNEKNPSDINYSTVLAEMYYYGLGVKEDKALALKYYDRLFVALKEKDADRYNSNAVYILANSIGKCNFVDYCKVKIPKELVIENIKDIPAYRLNSISIYILDYLSENGESALYDKFEKAFIKEKDSNAMAYAARRFFDRNTPEGDKKAFEIYSQMMELGHTLTLSELGSMFFNGRGAARNYKKAFEIFKKAADKKGWIDSTSCIWTALMYKNGWGVEKSDEMARKYVELAEGAHNYEYDFTQFSEQLICGDCCIYNFKGAPKCPDLGVELLERVVSSKNPNVDSFRRYAILLEDGKYIKRDLKKAASYYEKFARQRKKENYAGDEDYWGFGDAIRILKNSPKESDRKKAFELAREWLGAVPDSINAKVDIALLKMYGLGTEKNPKEAVAYLNKAIASKLKKEMYLWRAYGVLAYCHMNGIGVEKSPERVREIVSAVRKIKVSKCGVWHPFLSYAEWFNPNREFYDTDIVDNPALPPDKEISLFWLREFEKVADTAKNPKFSVKAYGFLVDYFTKERGFEDPQKAGSLKEKLAKAKERVEAAKKKPGAEKNTGAGGNVKASAGG